MLVLRVAYKYSAAEVAEITVTSEGAIRVTQHRALAKLRRLTGITLDAEEDHS